MLPIAGEVFWGPMAYAIIGGLFIATLHTLLFLPALYVAWFRIQEPGAVPAPQPSGAETAGLFARWFARLPRSQSRI